MLNVLFVIGLVIFGASSVYFYVTGTKKKGLNAAFLVSFITLISYVLMQQGALTVETAAGQPIFWTRWVFYGLSCTLLMVEIAQLKRVQGGEQTHWIYLTAIVMLTGFLAARDRTGLRWVHFILSSVAYVLLLIRVLSVKTQGTQWVHSYIWFGWTVFPIVFLLAPTGFGWFGAGLTNLLYLLLDIYTKIIFNLQLARQTAKKRRTK